MMLPVVHRRQFLKIASVAAVGVALSERNLFAASSSGVVPLLSIGYAPSLPMDGFTVTMGDASSILSPDPTFINRGARISVVGGSRAKQYMDAPGGIGIDAYFPITGRQSGNYPRYTFWSATGNAPSGQLSFRMPALATTGLSFVVRRVRPTVGSAALNEVPALEPETSPLTLSLGNVAGPKLARGVYAFAFREEAGDSEPNWGRTLLMNQGGKYSLSGVSGVTYLLVEVDYDDEKAAVVPAPSRGRASRH
ncbi:MAG: hypothetical protein QOK37_3188 [Thermoanaerobaculia bacterium]|jgi:hypothetical protein|nr:hypothetical protein [Thermoanaerobaculia bacterium]